MTTKISTTAKIYADSLVQTGMDSTIVLENLENIKSVLNSSEDLKIMINNPSIDISKKLEVINSIFVDFTDEKILKFLNILVSKNRISELDKIIKAYSDEIDRVNNLQDVEIISAIDITENYKSQIINKLQTKIRKNIRPEWKIDENIIGGLVIKVEDDIFDDSIKSKLDKISKI